MAIPKYKRIEPIEFTQDTIHKMFDENGNWIGLTQTKLMTKEEIKTLWPLEEGKL